MTRSATTAALAAVLSVAMAAAASARTGEGSNGERRDQQTQRGEASFYGPKFSGRRMANGGRFDPQSDSAAHRSLPLGTTARVTNLENGRTETVTVEDRGPYVRRRIIDVSPRTAERLGMREHGVVQVEVRSLRAPQPDRR